MSRWDPFSEALSLRDAMNRLFEQAVLQPSGESGQRGEGGFAPALDVCETPDEYIVEASLPGVDPKDVDIELHQGVLTIRGEVNEERHHEQHQRQAQARDGGQVQQTQQSQQGQQGQRGQHSGTYHIRERRMGRFYRSITLPMAVNAEQAKADFHNGILTLTIPKAEETKPRRIQVQSGGAAQGSQGQIQGAGMHGTSSGMGAQSGGMAGTGSGTGAQSGGSTTGTQRGGTGTQSGGSSTGTGGGTSTSR
jgi:HSP20 family protein